MLRLPWISPAKLWYGRTMATTWSTRPLPKQLLTAYRKPMELIRLAMSSVLLSDRDMLTVRWRFAQAADRMFGPIWIEVYDKPLQENVDMPLLEFVEHVHRQRTTNSGHEIFGIILQSEDVTDQLALMRELAKILQPFWAKYWYRFTRGQASGTPEEAGAEPVAFVLSKAQLRWITIQMLRYELERLRVKMDDGVESLIQDQENHALEMAKDQWAQSPLVDSVILASSEGRVGRARAKLAYAILGEYSRGVDIDSRIVSMAQDNGGSPPATHEMFYEIFGRCFGDHPPELNADGWESGLYIR